MQQPSGFQRAALTDQERWDLDGAALQIYNQNHPNVFPQAELKKPFCPNNEPDPNTNIHPWWSRAAKANIGTARRLGVYKNKPTQPRPLDPPAGIYLHFNQTGTVIYVGKGSRTRARHLGMRKPEHIKETHKIRWRGCRSHADALVLEAMLIRKHQPKYNIVGVTR